MKALGAANSIMAAKAKYERRRRLRRNGESVSWRIIGEAGGGGSSESARQPHLGAKWRQRWRSGINMQIS